MVITFCGHSTYVFCEDDEEKLLNAFERVIKGKEVEFYLGGYGNFDSFALKCAKRYKAKHTNAKLVYITPYLDKRLNERKNELLKIFDEIIYPDLEFVPRRFAILKRNEWMVDNADYIFAYVKTHYGGAYKTLLYTDKRGKSYTNLYNGDYELY